MRNAHRFPFEVRCWSPLGPCVAVVTVKRLFRNAVRAERFAEKWLARRPLAVTESGHFSRSEVYSADVTNRRTGKRTAVDQPEYAVQSVGARGVW